MQNSKTGNHVIIDVQYMNFLLCKLPVKNPFYPITFKQFSLTSEMPQCLGKDSSH